MDLILWGVVSDYCLLIFRHYRPHRNNRPRSGQVPFSFLPLCWYSPCGYICPAPVWVPAGVTLNWGPAAVRGGVSLVLAVAYEIPGRSTVDYPIDGCDIQPERTPIYFPLPSQVYGWGVGGEYFTVFPPPSGCGLKPKKNK